MYTLPLEGNRAGQSLVCFEPCRPSPTGLHIQTDARTVSTPVPSKYTPGVLQRRGGVDQAQDAQGDRDVFLLHGELVAQRGEESVQRKLGGRVRSGEGSGYSS